MAHKCSCSCDFQDRCSVYGFLIGGYCCPKCGNKDEAGKCFLSTIELNGTESAIKECTEYDLVSRRAPVDSESSIR